MKYINKIKNKLNMIYNNIKYILCDDIIKYDDIINNIDTRLNNCENDINDVENDVNDKVNEYDVDDIIYNQMGSSDDYLKYDDINDIKDEMQVLKDDLKNDVKYLTAFCKELKDDIKAIESNIYDIHQHLKTHKIDTNQGNYSIKEWDLLVNQVIDDIIIRLRNNDNV